MMARLRLRYVQGYVDRGTGVAFYYFRRRGYRRIRLPGLPGSAEFIAAYQQALSESPMPVSATRTRAGSVNAAVIGYYDSATYFGSLAPTTQTKRRQILERFRAEHGDKPIALLPQKFITVMLSKLKPTVAIAWLGAIRHVMQYAVSANLCESDPTQASKLNCPGPTVFTLGVRASFSNMKLRTRSARKLGWRWR
jgi:hypothetical protein